MSRKQDFFSEEYAARSLFCFIPFYSLEDPLDMFQVNTRAVTTSAQCCPNVIDVWTTLGRRCIEVASSLGSYMTGCPFGVSSTPTLKRKTLLPTSKPGRVAQSVGHLTRKSEVLGSIPGLATCFRFSFR